MLSSAGTQSTTIAYALLTLSLTHSAVDTGIVTFARVLPFAFGIVGGVVSDRFDRKLIMIVADVVRAITIGLLVLATLTDTVEFWEIAAVAAIEGACFVFFTPAASGALRAIVPESQLQDAASAQETRSAVVSLAGPPLGGALFNVARALPFVADVVSYIFSTASLLLIRRPFQPAREEEHTSVRESMAEGFHFLWSQPFLRATTLLYSMSNFTGPGLLLALVVLGKRDGLSGGAIGGLLAMFGAATLIGALASPLVRRLLPTRSILVLELWLWVGCAAFVVWPNVYVLAGALAACGFSLPITDSVVIGYRLAVTPHHLVSRVDSVRTTIALVVAPFGPLAAGALLESLTARDAIGIFAAISLAAAACGTFTPAMRTATRIEDIQPPAPDGVELAEAVPEARSDVPDEEAPLVGGQR
jgi:Transmembrane secretion effector